jgi:DNA-binding MarR family transcriptional regulator
VVAGDESRDAVPAAAQLPDPDPTDPDPTEQSRWHPLHVLIREMNADIGRVYAERRVSGITPRQVLPLIRIGRQGPMTVRELASNLGVTHSAASQTAAALVKSGYARMKSGTDARTRSIALTAKGRALVPLFEAEWRATESAISDLETEIPYALSQVARDLAAALEHRSFYERISERLLDEL